MDDVFVQGLTVLLTVVGTTVAVSNHLHSKFNRLGSELRQLVTEQAVDTAVVIEKLAQLRETIDDLVLFRINQNTELINHRAQRFDEVLKTANTLHKERHDALKTQLKESADIVLGKIARLDGEINEIQQFLAKESKFKIRDRA